MLSVTQNFQYGNTMIFHLERQQHEKERQLPNNRV